MAGLKHIKGKIQATERTHKVTRAMEAVSAVKMRKTQEAALAGRSYAAAAASIIARLAGSEYQEQHPLFQKREGNRILVLSITSDKGLAGSVNASVLRKLDMAAKQYSPDRSLVDVYAVGKKGKEYFTHRGARIIASAENAQDAIAMDMVQDVVDVLTEYFLSGEYHTCLVGYPQFKSTFEQEPTVRTLLPLSVDVFEQVVREIVPDMGKYSSKTSLEKKEADPRYLVEPSPEEVLTTLIPKLLTITVYHMLLEAKASEHSARMVAMKNASDKSRDVTKQLNLEFNRARQALITREVSEIISGIEAMAT